MKYTKKALVKLLQDADVSTTAKSIAELLIIALDNGVVKREDILCPEQEKPIKEKPEGKKLRGRPRKNPPKEVKQGCRSEVSSTTNDTCKSNVSQIN